MRLKDRYSRLTFWNKIGFWGAIASIIGVVIGLASLWMNEGNSPEGLYHPTPSPEFTIGYLSARAQWAVLGGIHTLCIEESPKTCEAFIKFLQKQKQPYDPSPFLSELEQYASTVGWPSKTYFHHFRKLVSPDSIVKILKQVVVDGDSARRSSELARLSEEIQETALLVFLDGQQHGLNKADLGLIFLGNQVGKTEQTIMIGRFNEQEDKIIGPCRNWIGVIARFQLNPEFQLEKRLRPIWAEYPNILSRFNSLSLEELSAIIGRIKNQFLAVTDPTLR